MAVEFFFVPMVISPTEARGAVWAKYAHDPAVSRWSHIRYSRTSSTLLMLDGTQTYLDFVAAQSDAYRICAEGDFTENILGPASVAIKNWLEALNIPANWISAADSYRQVLRGVIGIFMFTQRHEGLNGSGFFEDLAAPENGFDLNTQWQNLNQSFRDTMQATIDDHNWAITPANNDQVRKMLKDFSDKWEGTTYYMANVEI